MSLPKLVRGMVLGTLALLCVEAGAADRVALVIGNASYAQAPTLNHAAEVEATLGLGRSKLRRIQQGLTSLGFKPGPADGVFGRRTRKAIAAWQTSLGEAPTGYLDRKSAGTLLAGAGTEDPNAPAGETTLDAGEATRPAKSQGIVVQGAMDTLAEALSTARSITYDESRAVALSQVAAVQAKANDRRGAGQSIAEALSIARNMTDDNSLALGSIVKAQVKTGDIAGALGTARSIAKFTDRLLAFTEIAEAKLKAGDRRAAAQAIAEGLSTIGNTSNDVAGDDALANRSTEIAETMTQINESARIITERIDKSLSTLALGDVAGLQVQLGDTAGAWRTARSIADEGRRPSVVMAIGIAQAQMGDIAGAMSTARTIFGRNSHDELLWHIATAQAQANDIAAAMRTTRFIAEGLGRAMPLSDIAVAQAKAGDSRGAAVSFAEAMAFADKIERDWVRGSMFINIAKKQAEAGHDTDRSIAKALSIVQTLKIKMHPFYSMLQEDIAVARALAGDIAGALSTAREIKGERLRAGALVGIAEVQLDAVNQP